MYLLFCVHDDDITTCSLIFMRNAYFCWFLLTSLHHTFTFRLFTLNSIVMVYIQESIITRKCAGSFVFEIDTHYTTNCKLKSINIFPSFLSTSDHQLKKEKWRQISDLFLGLWESKPELKWTSAKDMDHAVSSWYDATHQFTIVWWSHIHIPNSLTGFVRRTRTQELHLLKHYNNGITTQSS